MAKSFTFTTPTLITYTIKTYKKNPHPKSSHTTSPLLQTTPHPKSHPPTTQPFTHGQITITISPRLLEQLQHSKFPHHPNSQIAQCPLRGHMSQAPILAQNFLFPIMLIMCPSKTPALTHGPMFLQIAPTLFLRDCTWTNITKAWNTFDNSYSPINKFNGNASLMVCLPLLP